MPLLGVAEQPASPGIAGPGGDGSRLLQRLCHNDPFPPGTHGKGWLNSDTTAFHGGFVPSVTCATCHPITGHPTCTTCHFDATGSRDYPPLNFTHDSNVYGNHQDSALASAAGTVCEN